MSAKKASDLAQRLWTECRNAPNHTITQEKLLEAVGEKESLCKQAINTLLSKNLLLLLTDTKTGKNTYQGISREDAAIKGNMDADEHLVYSHISGSRNEGIWTKTLKARTNLHQTVLNRCLKKLEGKQLVKTITSVKFPTRKIYMRKDLEPSADVSGGPWYTDHELDTAFIESHSEAILVYIRSRSFPEATDECSEMLYPTSVTKYYPTAAQITVWLKKAQISPTELEEGDVQMLLDMLVYSGEIEVLPRTGFRGGGAFDSDESAAEGEDHDHDESGDSDHDEKKRKRNRSVSRAHSSSSKVEEGNREDENDEDEIASRPIKRRRKNDQSKTRSNRGQSSDDVEFDLDFARVETFDGLGASSASGSWKGSLTGGTGVVYRALRRERMGLGWAQTPCGRCPQFDFCSDKDKGPVNPDQCKYYRDWLEAPIGEISAVDI